jgi:hypothetical protein
MYEYVHYYELKRLFLEIVDSKERERERERATSKHEQGIFFLVSHH